jgi:hypothetical protein
LIGQGLVYNIRSAEDPLFVLGLGFHGYASMVALLQTHRVGDDQFFGLKPGNYKPLVLVGASGVTTGIPTSVLPPAMLPPELRKFEILLKQTGDPEDMAGFSLKAGVQMTANALEKLQRAIGAKIPRGMFEIFRSCGL